MPVGPLTNIAEFFTAYPELKRRIARIYMMGGASQKIEFNILCDCRAANIVFQSGVPITMVPLDITTKVRISSQKLKSYCQNHKLLEVVQSFLEFGTLPDSDCMHDPCTVLAYVYPEIFQNRLVYAEAVEEGDEEGRLILRDLAPPPEWSPIDFIDNCDAEIVIQKILEGLIQK